MALAKSSGRIVQRPVRMFTAILLALASASAPALMIGEMEQLSGLGQPFRARVAFQLQPGESIDPGCIRAIGTRPDSAMEVPVLLNARARIETAGTQSFIVLESGELLAEPIIHLVLDVLCERTASVTRHFTLLSDPLEMFARNEAAAVPPVAATAPSPSAPGDTVRPLVIETVTPVAKPAPGLANVEPAVPKPAMRAAKPAPLPRPAAATPASPTQRAIKPKVPPQDVLRLEAPSDEAEDVFGSGENGCCFRLSYELAEREGVPVTEAERDRLRMEYAERMGEGEILQRLLSLREQINVLKGQVNDLNAQHIADDERRERDAQSEHFAWMASGILGLVALAAGAWLWWKRPRREPFAIEGLDLSDTAPPPASADLSPESGNESDIQGIKAENAPAPPPREPARDTSQSLPFPAGTKDSYISGGTTETATAPRIPAEAAATAPTPAGIAYDGGIEKTMRLSKPPAMAVAPPEQIEDRSSAREPEGRDGITLPDPEPLQEAMPAEPGVQADSAFDFDLSDDGFAEPHFDLRLDSTPSDPAELSLDPETLNSGFPLLTSDLPGPDAAEPDPDFRLEEAPPIFPESKITPTPATSGAARITTVPAENDIDPALAAERSLAYRKAYIAERFPEIAAGSIELDKPATVVEGARIMYQEDQDVSRSVGLLELAWSMEPRYVDVWLCLFEIYWLEGMQASYVDLARRFQDAFSRKHPEWPMIAKLGRELDPANGLFRPDGLPAVQDSTPNWLNAQLDMMGHVLTRELRDQVLEQSAVAHEAGTV